MMSFFRRLFRTQLPVAASTQPQPTETLPKVKNFRLHKLDSERSENGVKAYGFEVLTVGDSRTSSVGNRLAFQVTSLMSPSKTELRDAGVYIFKVAGVSHRAGALQDKAFKPGSTLTLVIENDNPHDANAVSIWDERRRQMVGYVPREDNQTIRTMLRLHPDYQAISLREYRKSRKRVGLRAMLGPPTVTKQAV
jgi:HIRAN domain